MPELDDDRTQETLDAIQDLTREMNGIGRALTRIKPVINMPESPAIVIPPQGSPNIQVITRHCAWNFEVTSRDYSGRIKTFTATPLA